MVEETEEEVLRQLILALDEFNHSGNNFDYDLYKLEMYDLYDHVCQLEMDAFIQQTIQDDIAASMSAYVSEEIQNNATPTDTTIPNNFEPWD